MLITATDTMTFYRFQPARDFAFSTSTVAADVKPCVVFDTIELAPLFSSLLAVGVAKNLDGEFPCMF
jgi:hypothetical protein